MNYDKICKGDYVICIEVSGGLIKNKMYKVTKTTATYVFVNNQLSGNFHSRFKLLKISKFL
jgi:hypothetical protein